MAEQGLRANIHRPEVVPGEEDNLQELLAPPGPSQFGRGLRAGAAGLAAGAARAGEAAGLDTAQYAAAQEQIVADEVAKARVSTVEGIDDVTDFTDWAAFKLGEIAPSVLASLAGGGTGGLFGRAVAGGTKLGARADAATKVGAATGLYATSAVPQAGQIFQEIREESGIEAPGAAFAGGAVAGGLDIVPQLRLFNRIMRPGGGPIGRQILSQAAAEGVTEASQEAIALQTRALVDPTFDPLAEPNLDETISRLINAGATGVLGGSVGGAVADISALRSRFRDARTGRPGALPPPEGAALSTTIEDALNADLVQQLRDAVADTNEPGEVQDIQDRIEALEEGSRPGGDAGMFDLINSTEFFKGAVLSADAREFMGLSPIPPERDSLLQRLAQMNEQWFRDNPDQVVDPQVQPYRVVTALDAAEEEAMRAFPYDANLRRRYIEDFAQGVLDDKEGVTAQRKYAQARLDYQEARRNKERAESKYRVARDQKERTDATQRIAQADEDLARIAEQGAEFAEQLTKIQATRTGQPLNYRELGMREGQFDPRQFLRSFETIAGATTQRPEADLTFDRLPPQRVEGSTNPENWVSWVAEKKFEPRDGEFVSKKGKKSNRIVNLPNAIAQVRRQGFRSPTRADGREPTRMEQVADEMATAVTLLNEQGWIRGVNSRQDLVDLVGADTVVAYLGPNRTQPVTLSQVLDQGFRAARDDFPERVLAPDFDPTEIETPAGEGLETFAERMEVPPEQAQPPETDTRGEFVGTEPARPRFEPFQRGRRETTVVADELERRIEQAETLTELQQVERDFLGPISERTFGLLGQSEAPPLRERPVREQLKTARAGLKRLRKSSPSPEIVFRQPDALSNWQDAITEQERRVERLELEVRVGKQIRRRLKNEVGRLRNPRRRSKTGIPRFEEPRETQRQLLARVGVAPVPPVPTPEARPGEREAALAAEDVATREPLTADQLNEAERQRRLEAVGRSQTVWDDPELQRLAEEDQAIAQGSGWTEDGERRIEAAQRAVRDMRLRKEEAIRLNRTAVPISEATLEGFQQLGNRGLREFVGMRETLGLSEDAVQFVTPQNTAQYLEFLSEDLQRPDFRRSIERGNTSGLTLAVRDATTDQTKIFVWVRPDLDFDLHTRTLAHEMGHALYMNRAAEIPTDVARAMMDEYSAWLKKYKRPDISALEVLRSKKGDAAAFLALVSADRVGYANIELREMSEGMQEYLLSFDEWWADRVSEWMHRPAEEARTSVERFFAAIAAALRRLFDTYPVERTVDDYLASLSGGRRKWTVPASSLDLGKVAQPDWQLPRDVRSGIARFSRGVFDADPDDVANMAWQDTNGTLRGEMYSAWIADVWDALTPQMRSVLGRTALSAPVQSQLRRLLANSEEALRQIREPKVASAYAYMFWRAGELNLQGDMLREYKSIRDTFFNIVRYIANEDGELPNPQDVDESARVFDALREHRMRVDPTDGRFEAAHRVQDGELPVSGRWADAYERLARVGSSFFSTVDSRLRSTENPALIQLSNMLARGTGRVTTEPGYWQSRNMAIGRFTNIAKSVFEGMTLEESSEFLDYVYSAKDYNDAPTEWQGKIDTLRKLMREMLNYQRDAGIEINDLGETYFPWVLDLEEMENNREGFYEVVGQDKYRKDRIGIAETVNKRRLHVQADNQGVQIPQERINQIARAYAELASNRTASRPGVTVSRLGDVAIPNWVNDSELIGEGDVPSYIYDGALNSQGYVDVEVELENDAPYMRFMNTRLLKFVDPTEIRPFLSDDAAQTILSYIYQAAKHAEYTRRFGEDNSKLEQLLEEAEEFGATTEDLKLATDAVHANMGTYGIERAVWLNKHLGLALPRPRAPINDTLNRGMGAMLVFQNLKYLGLATITSLVDPLGIGVRGNSLSMAVKSMARAVVDTARREPTQLQDLAEMLGLIEHTSMNEAMSWRFEGQYMQGMSKKINDTWFKVIGLDSLTRMTRLAATSAAQSFIRKHVLKPNQHSERYLTELNLRPGDVRFNADGMLTLLDEQQRTQAGPEELARDNRVRQAIVQFVDESILRPNPMQRTLWGSDPHFMLFQHLKSFMYSFYVTILKRVGNELANHNFYSLVTLGMYIPAMIVSTAIRDLIRYGEDGNPYKADWTLWNYLEDGAMRAGLYGYMGTLGADIMQDVEYGGFGMGGMFSTLTSTIEDIDNVLLLEGDALIEQLPGSVIYENWLQ